MRQLNGAAQRAAAAFTAHRGLLIIASDFDGVLAPLVDDPTASRVLPRSARALAALGGADPKRVRLALVSGRRLADLAALASPPPGTLLYGTHGAESGVIEEDGTVSAVTSALTDQQLATLEELRTHAGKISQSARGAWLENKSTSVVLHTRLAGESDSARIAAELLAYCEGKPVFAMSGHDVVEVSVIKVSKGNAVAQLRADLGASAVFYMGDDVTDETVFRVLDGPDLAVKVGPGVTAAGERVQDPDEASLLLEVIADMVTKDRG
ncbi:trehalose-phosphatase [Timonella senegalensis]|uniref:trehalose-phosphatase n=2 Tax=Timonella senegalensis TaxID=1465825 RepID=UPI00030EF4D5|nr:trehalose-phosphatase [Timonella senegalensis]